MDERAKKSAILAGIGVALSAGLAFMKLHVGLTSNSITVLLDATNGFLDVVTYLIALVSFLTLLKPSKNLGYGRVEYLASFVVSVVAVVFGGIFFFRSFNRMAMPEPIWFGWQNCVMLAVTVPVKLCMGFTFLHFGKKYSSSALTAIALDCFCDVGVTATSLVSFAISGVVDYAVDAIVGIVLSVIIVAFGVGMVIKNVKIIVHGKDFSEEKESIVVTCKMHGLDVKDIVFHDYGAKSGVSVVKVFFDGNMEEFYPLSSAVKAEILEKTGVAADIVPENKQD